MKGLIILVEILCLLLLGCNEQETPVLQDEDWLYAHHDFFRPFWISDTLFNIEISEPIEFVIEIEYPENQAGTLYKISSDRTMTFYNNDGNEVGVLSFGGDTITFAGSADASAQRFFHALFPYFQEMCQ